MRIFIIAPDLAGSTRKTRLTLVDCSSTSQLLKRISSMCSMHQRFVIAKIKQERVNIRIIEGWSLDAYPLRQGSQIIVEILPEGYNSFSPELSPSKLGQIGEEFQLELETREPNSFDQQNYSSSSLPENDWTQYFQQSLEQFLTAVRNKSIEEAAGILKAEPECSDDKLLTKLVNKKVYFLLNELGECGRAAIHWAVQQKDLDMVQFLLIKSGDPNIVSQDEYTPLQLAITLRASSIFQTLLAHPRIDLNKTTNKGTALHVAIQLQEFNYAQKLIDSGASLQVEKSEKEPLTPWQLIEDRNIVQLKQSSTKSSGRTVYLVRGKVFKIGGLITTRLKQRILLVNPYSNQFIVFEEKQIDLKINLLDIKSVKVLKQKSWTMKKEYFYFQVIYNQKQLVLCVRNDAIGEQWVKSINSCMKYVQNNKNANKKDQQQAVLVLDDQKNLITLHKKKNQEGKSPNKTKKLSMFDLKPMSDAANHENLVLNKQQLSSTYSKNRLSEDTANISAIETRNEDEEDPSAYLRDSELLGSVIGNQMLFRGSATLLSTSFGGFNQKPLVCFKDFEILRQLGVGSFGKVFLARHRKQQKLYALKVLNKKKLTGKKQLKYAVSEANILKKVDSHFIIKLHYSFQTPTNLYIAIDYCPHGDLCELLNQDQRLSEKACRFFIAQLILAVEYLHNNNIIYRDLKPENILIGEDGFIRLTDFNLSKENSFSASFCGSPAYLSPEMLEKKGVGFESDIYGIGCVLYEMLVGEPPFFDEEIEVLYENIRNGKLKFPSALSKAAKSLISGLLERNTKKRLGAKDINQIKGHQFFYGFEWEKLQKMQLKVPSEIEGRLSDKQNGLEAIKEHGFVDSDYQNNANMINRIKNFTFVRPRLEQ